MTPELDKIAQAIREEMNAEGYVWLGEKAAPEFARRLVTKLGDGQEPATTVHNTDTPWHFAIITPALPAGTKLYLHPPLRQPDAWKEAVIDKLVVCHILNSEHENNPRKAIKDIIAWNVEIALDPSVSEDAAKLIQRGKDTAQPDAEVLEAAYERGWIAAAKWSGEWHILSDIGSPAYIDDRDATLNKPENKNDQG